MLKLPVVLVFVVFRPVMHRNVRYNCRVLFLNRYIRFVTCYLYGLAGLNLYLKVHNNLLSCNF